MSVMDGLKQAASTLRAADKIPEYNAILDAQQRIFDLQNENQELKEKNVALTDKKDLEGQLHRDDNSPWLAMEDDEDPTARYCMLCWDTESTLVRLYVDDKGYYEKHCKKCDNRFMWKPDQPPMVTL